MCIYIYIYIYLYTHTHILLSCPVVEVPVLRGKISVRCHAQTVATEIAKRWLQRDCIAGSCPFFFLSD